MGQCSRIQDTSVVVVFLERNRDALGDFLHIHEAGTGTTKVCEKRATDTQRPLGSWMTCSVISRLPFRSAQPRDILLKSIGLTLSSISGGDLVTLPAVTPSDSKLVWSNIGENDNRVSMV